MNTFDKILIVFSGIQLVFAIYYLYWQFIGTSMSEPSMTRVIRALDLAEWAVFVATRFLPYGKYGKIALATFYISIAIILTLQFIFGEFGAWEKVKDILWIGYYTILFMIDILAIDVFGELASRVGPTLMDIDSYLKDSWIGIVLKAVLVAIIKGIIFPSKKEKVEWD